VTSLVATEEPVEAAARSEPTPPTGEDRARPWAVEHGPFLAALGLGAVLRVLMSVAFTPALMVSDGPRYLAFLDGGIPPTDRVVGYSLLVLTPVTRLTDDLRAVTTVQHLLGMGTGVILYVVLRRWGVGRWGATLAALPVLLDAMELMLEHAPLSDTTFVFLVAAGLGVLCWRPRPTVALAFVAGLLLGASTTVRQVGPPLVVTGVGFCLLVGRGWRARVATAVVLAVGFAVPVGAYASWYHSEHGTYALSEVGGRASYMRTTTYVDCDRLSLESYQQVLCPPERRGERLDPSLYGWSDERTVRSLEVPPGTTEEEALADFARQARRAQPLDHAAIVARDIALGFDVNRADRFEHDTAWKWQLSSFVDLEPDTWTGPAFQAHGGEQLRSHQPWADLLVTYQRVGYVPGPVVLACLVLGLVGGLSRRRRGPIAVRAATLLITLSGLALILVPAVTTQFVWRYQLPGIVLLPAGAALGWVALRGRQGDGTRATPSTD